MGDIDSAQISRQLAWRRWQREQVLAFRGLPRVVVDMRPNAGAEPWPLGRRLQRLVSASLLA
ncbi:hypothetical protein BN873_p60003 [Candidatus Competibacter denitrificans Run_A_D11]|uniref:Uncharacterized protein n=1 Tax=Candidatus Competibacter denitrificans Run_A_D11 TaxID=1400863 RepID=W6MEJ9_9GAMM|nr:hypothetical protein BN873_p60003 [Candidatus Competibacter denitrificans Run_A_D11]